MTSHDDTPTTPTDSRRTVVYDYAKILAGSLLMALSVDLFLVPNDIVAGGLTGLAVLFNHLVGGGVGLVTFVLNLPVLWLGWKHIGGSRFFIRTMVGVISFSLYVDLLAPLLPVPTDDRLLIIFYGGIMNGVGLAMVFRGRGTTGGVDILSQLAHKWWGFDVGRAMLVMNVVVLGLAGLVFGLEPAMVALLVAWATSMALDAVLHGLSASRQAMIVSDRHEEISASIIKNLNRGVTVLEGTGAFTGDPRKVLFIVVQRHEAHRLKMRVEEIDPHAFVVISSPQEVRGGYPMPWRS